MRHLLIAAINFYQRNFSPDHGPRRRLHPLGYCRFYPTCSMYAKKAIASHGAIKGGWLSVRRVARCHPWSGGGVDPVPTHNHNL